VDYGKLFDLEGKFAVVTGGSGGIGRAIALGLAAHGADVMVAGRNPERTAETADQVAGLGRKSAVFQLEVSSLGSARDMAAKAMEEFGRIDILVNSAGMNIRKPILEIGDEDWDPVLTVNLKGTLYCCQAVGRIMVEQNSGKIINVASVSSKLGHPARAAYAASKV